MLSTAVEQCDSVCKPDTIYGLLKLTPQKCWSPLDKLSDAEEVQYNFWVHETFVAAQDMRRMHVARKVLLAEPWPLTNGLKEGTARSLAGAG